MAGPVEHAEIRGGKGAGNASAGSGILSEYPAGLHDEHRTSSQRTPGNRHRSGERCRGRSQNAPDTGHDPAGSPATNPLGHINRSQRTAV